MTTKRSYSPNTTFGVHIQLQLALIPHKVENAIIPQRASDGYVNATAMCDACGKKISNYFQNDCTREFLKVLEADAGIPASELVIVRKGGLPLEQGTWVHPDVAINLGQWCSAKFAVAVAKWVREWIQGKATSVMPYHIERYLENAPNVPPGYFSMLNELTLHFIAPLERHGYTLPDNLVPDISEGKVFCNWLRKNTELDPKNFKKYDHHYADGRIVQANLYPLSILEAFRNHFHTVWLPTRMIGYFKEKDPSALNFTHRAFPSLYGKSIGRI